MVCDDEYNALVKATEKLHESYYQQETADIQFANSLRTAQSQLILSGLSRLVNASVTEIIYSLEERTGKDFVLLHEAATAKSQVDSSVLAAEESYQYASQRYEDCLKENTEKIKNS
ncbi:MAG: hypothetical protein ACREA3_06850 [Nitrosotalea sp.]